MGVIGATRIAARLRAISLRRPPRDAAPGEVTAEVSLPMEPSRRSSPINSRAGRARRVTTGRAIAKRSDRGIGPGGRRAMNGNATASQAARHVTNPAPTPVRAPSGAKSSRTPIRRSPNSPP